ncbi:MAG: hypothetical protein L0228_14865 [Planctomycetes bacterium]|nr:hypothetical protein [Planctomycetota bacterium]
MNWLAENALPIWVCGAVALTMALVVYLQIRTSGALLTVVVVIMVTSALLLAERLMETPREAVERTLYDLAATVEKNDVVRTINFISPNSAPNAAELRKDVGTLMPLVRIERARVTGVPQIEISDDGNKALVKCRGVILAVNKQNGMKGGGEDHFTMEWIRNGDLWLLNDYVSQKNWRTEVGR